MRVGRNKFGVRIDRAGKERRTVDNITFASLKEKRRYEELKLLVAVKAIRDLELQPKFSLEVNDQKICDYIADFAYFDLKEKRVIYEDAKGFKTPEYRLKKKLVRALYKIEVREV